MRKRKFFNPKTWASGLIASLTLGIKSIPDGMASRFSLLSDKVNTNVYLNQPHLADFDAFQRARTQ